MAREQPIYELGEDGEIRAKGQRPAAPAAKTATAASAGPQPIAWARAFLIIALVAHSAAAVYLIAQVERNQMLAGWGFATGISGMVMLALGWPIIRIAESCIYLASRPK